MIPTETSQRNSKRLAVDIGGTFTDIVIEIDGRPYTSKILTTPGAPEEGVLQGIRELLEATGLGFADLDVLIHGTTLATNAIIERKGAETALVSTDGFRDVLEIADEGRYDQYDVFIDKPLPLVPRRLRFTVPERIDINGDVLTALDEKAARALVPRVQAMGVTSVAVGFLHSYMNPQHEERMRELLQEVAPELAVSLSSEVCPEIREYERFSTTCANAYVQPLMARYLERLAAELGKLGLRCPVLLMTSGGGLTTLDTAIKFPVRLVESGPAGGAILASYVAKQYDLDKVLSFDMGGTTAKICLIEDRKAQMARTFEVDRASRFRKGSGLPVRVPVIEMVEIGAGGGSIARLNALRQIAVGPDSAGAEPGPACYGRNGVNATVTDADVVLGRIDPEDFAGGFMRLHIAKARTALESAIAAPLGLSHELAAYGVAEMVDETMANAARVHSVERGQSAAEHTLVAFGGAAPLHAARLAEKLGIGRVLVPANAGVGSAIGFLRAPIAYEVVRSRYLRLKDFDAEVVNTLFEGLYDEAIKVVAPAAMGKPVEEIRVAFMRYVGQGHEIAVPLPSRRYRPGDAAMIQNTYDELYASQYARAIPHADVEILTWSLTLSTAGFALVDEPRSSVADESSPKQRTRQVFDPMTDEFGDVPVYKRSELEHGNTVAGPCVIVEDGTSTFVTATFEVSMDERRTLVLARCGQP